MDVIFERTSRRSYAVEVHRPGAPTVRMDPAPGYDDHFPHDLQHFIVEEQLGLTRGIFGRIDQGGSAATFHLVTSSGTNARATARERRRLHAREHQLRDEPSDVGASERATYVAWYDCLGPLPDPARHPRSTEIKPLADPAPDRLPSPTPPRPSQPPPGKPNSPTTGRATISPEPLSQRPLRCSASR